MFGDAKIMTCLESLYGKYETAVKVGRNAGQTSIAMPL